MKIVRADRQKGKSTKLVQLSHVHGHVIICANRQRAEHLERLAYEMDMPIPTPVNIYDLKSEHFSRGVRECISSNRVLIDDLEAVLTALIGKQIIYATTSEKVIPLSKVI